MIDHHTDDDKNLDATDVTASDGTTTATTYATNGLAAIPKNPLSEHQRNGDNDVGNKIRKQQQQYQNLETWLQLTETAIQPFQQQNQVLLKNATNIARQSPQYTIQHGILSSNSSNNATDVVGSAMVKSTLNCITDDECNTYSTNSSVNTTAVTTETTSTILIATVTLQVGQPSIVAPIQGDVTVTLSNNYNSTMGASHVIQTIQSKLQRILDENIDLEQLHIIEGKMAYRLVVTITILFVESLTSITLFDACLLAATAALLDTKLPTHPNIHDGVLYSSPTTISSATSEFETTVTTSTSGIISNLNMETKSLYMPIIPISFTAICVRLPSSTVTDTQTPTVNHRNHKKGLHWIGDPTIDEQQISSSTTVTIVLNAAAIATASEDQRQGEDIEEILCIQLTPSSGATAIDHTLATSTLSSSNDTALSTAATAVSWIDLDNVMSMAHRHVKSLHERIQPK